MLNPSRKITSVSVSLTELAPVAATESVTSGSLALPNTGVLTSQVNVRFGGTVAVSANAPLPLAVQVAPAPAPRHDQFAFAASRPAEGVLLTLTSVAVALPLLLRVTM